MVIISPMFQPDQAARAIVEADRQQALLLHETDLHERALRLGQRNRRRRGHLTALREPDLQGRGGQNIEHCLSHAEHHRLEY
jgi:hypothetical protein